jgi:hypothetical protein
MILNQEERNFLYFCSQNNINKVKELMPTVKSVNFENDNGFYPLSWAVFQENYELLDLLLDYGGIINWIDDKNHTLVKHIVSIKMLNVLMDKGLDIHYNEHDSNSDLMHIISNPRGNLNVAKALIGLDVAYQHLDLSNVLEIRKNDIQHYTHIFECLYEKEALNAIDVKSDIKENSQQPNKKKKI